ncbi:MAG: chemotaxis protein CheW [Rhodospirillales bacterium]|jgi:purine-binding chemotaxis protein CheW|nr:chemotaxis protein CheW [Rhodospirillales bacterium]MBT3906120.1 chemotaxis protein CheW [Rhodospirillaceae bacterium]MBT5033590.1 chemotaxis protein CheW [Rhodospirillaceae bacterium]MBT6220072.1 chemotaxis protein CheW [Rhodospirillaceae bacterium]MBT6362027.1 chemotaxis protein CheW [Rhodospirillaceae bacterium]
MSNADLVVSETGSAAQQILDEVQDYLTVQIDGQMFGIEAMTVQDILSPRGIAKVPLAPVEVAGSINLRGRIVTAVDVRLRLGMPVAKDPEKLMNVVVDVDGELYSLLVDKVGDVLSMSQKTYESNPTNLNENWRDFAQGVHRLDENLMVICDVEKIVKLNS